jgi:ribonuclease Z
MFDPLDLDGWLVDPCVGFIIHEPASLPAPRKLAFLGDTSSGAGLTALVSSTPGRLSLLVHEATDAHMPEDIDPRFAARGPLAVIAAKAKERGHSTPPEAGARAGKWGARKLILNHIGTRWAHLLPTLCDSALFITCLLDGILLPLPIQKNCFSLRCRFPASFPGSNSGKRVAIIREIERQASEAWRATPCELPVELGTEATTMAKVADENECNAVAAYDFLTVQIPTQSTVDNNSSNNQGGGTGSQVPSKQQSRGYAPKRKRGRSGGTR